MVPDGFPDAEFLECDDGNVSSSSLLALTGSFFCDDCELSRLDAMVFASPSAFLFLVVTMIAGGFAGAWCRKSGQRRWRRIDSSDVRSSLLVSECLYYNLDLNNVGFKGIYHVGKFS